LKSWSAHLIGGKKGTAPQLASPPLLPFNGSHSQPTRYGSHDLFEASRGLRSQKMISPPTVALLALGDERGARLAAASDKAPLV
jgi:hypothetical protein